MLSTHAMADDARDMKPETVDAALGDMKLHELAVATGAGQHTQMVNGQSNAGHPTRSRPSTPAAQTPPSESPRPKDDAGPVLKSEDEVVGEEIVGGDVTVTVEPGKAPKLLRKSGQKVAARPPTLFHDLPDATEEATKVFQRIKDCIYGSKGMGSSEHDALDCDCAEEWSEYPRLPQFALR